MSPPRGALVVLPSPVLVLLRTSPPHIQVGGVGDVGSSVGGLGRTQRRGKEKEGPKKVRLSKMKKTILLELLQRHGRYNMYIYVYIYIYICI